jgi:hypothetical protein
MQAARTPLAFGGGGHDAAPERGFVVVAGVPDDERVFVEVVQHLRAETHLPTDEAVGGAFDCEGEAGDGVAIPEWNDVGGEGLLEQAAFAEHIVDGASVDPLEASKEFLDRHREGLAGNTLALGDQVFQLHHLGFALKKVFVIHKSGRNGFRAGSSRRRHNGPGR